MDPAKLAPSALVVRPTRVRWLIFSRLPAKVRTSGQGGVTALGRVAGARAPPLVAALLMAGLGLSWRAALLAVALPGVLLAVALWLALWNRPGEHPWANRAGQEGVE